MCKHDTPKLLTPQTEKGDPTSPVTGRGGSACQHASTVLLALSRRSKLAMPGVQGRALVFLHWKEAQGSRRPTLKPPVIGMWKANG